MAYRVRETEIRYLFPTMVLSSRTPVTKTISLQTKEEAWKGTEMRRTPEEGLDPVYTLELPKIAYAHPSTQLPNFTFPHKIFYTPNNISILSIFPTLHQ